MNVDRSGARGFLSAKRRALAHGQPLFALIEMTYRCNWRCAICYNPQKSEGSELAADEWERVVDELRELGTLVVTLTGGEPLLHPGFWRVAHAIRKARLALVVYTNGSLVDDNAAYRIAALDPLSVAMSLHGARAATHDAMTRVDGSHDAMLAGLRRLQERGVRVVLRTPLSIGNEAEIEDMVELAAALGAPYRVDPRLTPRDDGSRDPLRHLATEAATRRLFGCLAAVDQVPRVRLEPGGVNCGAGRLTLSIGPKGDVFPCIEWKNMPLGNVRERPLREIWNDSPARERVKSITLAANEMLRRAGAPIADYPFCPALAWKTEGDPLAIGRQQRTLARAAAVAETTRE